MPDLRVTLLERFPFLKSLQPDRLDQVVKQATVRTFAAKTVLFDANQRCGGFPLVIDGTVRVVKSGPNGREILLYRVDPGDSCILSGGCLMADQQLNATGIADTDVTIATIPPALFRELLAHEAEFQRYVFAMVNARLAEVMELIEEVAFRKLDSRLAQLLIHRGPVLQATHQRIAEELGSVREIVSRLLSNFESRGWVKLARERVTVVDPKALAELARA